MGIRGAILDSGNVLIRPSNDCWFPPAAFEAVFADQAVAWDRNRLARALAAGEAYLNRVHPIPLRDLDEERAVWTHYYEIVLTGVGVTRAVPSLARAMAAVSELKPGVEPYPWSIEVLAGLRERGVPVVILSDAWPSLRGTFRQLGLHPYVKAMVISGEEGITKPDPRVFNKALGLLGHATAEVVFVDDWPGHVQAAGALGMRGLRLRHATEESAPMLEEIEDLRELLALLE
jgi:putative hydrolase of the HAD superfamily